MYYLKHYSEMLFAWGEAHKAIQASKIVANAFKLLTIYHPNYNMNLFQKQTNLTKQDVFGNTLQVVKRPLEFNDYLLFSEHSLNYLKEEVAIKRIQTMEKFDLNRIRIDKQPMAKNRS